METWQEVFKLLITLLIGFLGAPVTQFIKAGLSQLFKKPVEDRWAVLLTVVLSGGLALLDMSLSGLVVFENLSPATFPTTFFQIFGLATLYFAWMKGSESVLGRGFLLKDVKRTEPPIEVYKEVK